MNPYYSIPGLKSQRFRDITCWIEGDDGPKYVCSPVRPSESNSSIGWIESVAGQSFVVKWHNNRREVPLEGKLYIDGTLCDTHILPDDVNYPDSRWATTTIGFAQTSPYTRRSFIFSDISKPDLREETDGYNPLNDQGRINQLGTIRLEIRRVQLESRRLAWDYINTGENILNNQPHGNFNDVPHQVKLGKEQKGHVYNVVVARGRPIDINPWYSFVFKYRPRDVLIANRLIPAQFLPPPPSPERKPFSAEEIQRYTEKYFPKARPAVINNPYSSSSTISSRAKEKMGETSEISNSQVEHAEEDPQVNAGGSRKPGGSRRSKMKKHLRGSKNKR